MAKRLIVWGIIIVAAVIVDIWLLSLAYGFCLTHWPLR